MGPMQTFLLLLIFLVTALTGSLPAEAVAAEMTVTPAQVQAVLENYLDQQRDVLPQAQIRFKSLSLPKPFRLPSGRLTTEVLPADPGILKSRRFNIIFRVNGTVVKNMTVRGKLEALAPVMVAAGDLRRGTLLSERDLNLEERDLVALRYPSFSPAELLGKKLKRTVRLGKAIERGVVDVPPCVKRGELVTITARSGALKITAKGEARQNGELGATIRIRNSATHKEVLCKVTAPGRAEVEF